MEEKKKEEIEWFPLGLRISDLEKTVKEGKVMITVFRKIVSLFDSWHEDNVDAYPGKEEITSLKRQVSRGGKYKWEVVRTFRLMSQRDHFIEGDANSSELVICFYAEPRVRDKSSKVYEELMKKSVEFNVILDEFLRETVVASEFGGTHVLGIPSKGFNFYRKEEK